MKESEDKQLETFANIVMSKSALETTSSDFTDNVMARVEKLEQSTITTYQPLISKSVWGFILVVFVMLITFIFYVIKPETSGWFSGYDFSAINTDKVSNLFKGIQPSKIVAYAIGLLALMLLIQVPILKSYFDKRIEF